MMGEPAEIAVSDEPLNVEKEVSVEIKTPKLEKIDLKNAFGFRVQLDGGPDQMERQIKLINELRLDEQSPMVAIQESTDTVLGFFWTESQFEKFKEVVSHYQGSYGIGASYGDSQISLVKGGGDESSYVITCEATNGAARTQKGQLAMRTELIDKEEEVFAYRYFLPTDEESTQVLIREGKVVVGAKGTYLEKIIISEVLFNDQPGVNLPGDLLAEIDLSEQKKEVLTNVTKMAILSIDINGFSNIVHKKTVELIRAKVNNASALEIQDKQAEIDGYLREIVAFFMTLESHVKNRLLARNLFVDVDEIFRSIEWRGDAGGVIVPTEYREILSRSLMEVVKAFPRFNVKATIKDYERLDLVSSKDKRTRASGEMDKLDSRLSEIVKEQHLDDGKNRTIIAEEQEGKMVADVYERGVQGDLQLVRRL